ncbi:YhgE/Pip family protein [Microbacterium sp. gxy059]|uniref:YhgE/Pip domain-containing protein n=1 Tax=Microbacterium sp. gxy059 TaxID=2957199 RepID=UPI003D96DB7D
MKKSWQVFARDVGRLARVRKAWIIVIGVLITPALYAWFNISAFWDPYSNTENVSVAVANLDEGATSDLTGAVNIGDQVEEQLRGNDDLGWDFMTDEEALEAVQRGDAYAAIVIPAGFSEDLLSITTGDFTQPALQYYVNEKSSAIAPKITDVGATELDRQITSAFAEEVASAASEAVRDAGDDAQQRLLNAQDRALNTFDSTAQRLASVRESIDDLQQGIDSSRESLSSTRRTLGDIDATLGDVQQAIDETQGIIAEARTQVIDFTDAATAAYLQGTTRLADASSSANTSVTQLTQSLDAAGVRVEAAIEDLQGVLESNEAAIAELRTVLDDADLDPDTAERLSGVIEALEERNAADQQLLSELSQLSSSAAETVQALQTAADAVDGAMQDTQSAAVDLRVALTENLPALNSAMSQLSESAGEFSAAVGSQRRVLAQAGELLLGVDAQLASTSVALGSFDDDIANIESSVQTARTDVEALVAASELGALSTLTGLDPDDIAQFIASPVEVDEQILFPVSSYGSAMAALFTNLSLWIGSFVLMVIFKIEVDTEGVEGVSVREAYLGRFGLFAMLAVAQALIVSIGNLIIGVQTASAVAFVGTAVLIGLAYVSIIYALCVAFGHVGRGLCILLVIMQIPGASGLYPIEMMPDFFRAIYPLLPFSYGIDAMRETIAGFYGNHYWRFMGALAVFVALAFLLGLVLRRRLANLHVLFNREIASTDLLIGEKVQVTGTGYRLSQVIHALSDRREYRDELVRRARPFTRHYPTLLRATLVVGLAGMLLLAVVAWLFPEGKALLLGLWSLWCLLVIGFLVAIEYTKQSFARAHAVAALEDAELREVILAGGAGHLAEDAAQASAETTRIDVPAETVEIDEGDAPAGPDEEADLLDEIFAFGEPAERDEPDPDAETTELDVVDEQDETGPADEGEERA